MREIGGPNRFDDRWESLILTDHPHMKSTWVLNDLAVNPSFIFPNFNLKLFQHWPPEKLGVSA